MYNVLYEIDIHAKDVNALNQSVKIEEDLAGGSIVALGAKTDDVFAASAPAEATDAGLYMLYNPAINYIRIGGKLFAGDAIDIDVRDYANPAEITTTAFRPEEGDVIGVLAEAFEGATVPTKEQFCEPTAGKYTFSVKESQTEGAMSWKCVGIEKQAFPKAAIGEEYVDKYILMCVNN